MAPVIDFSHQVQAYCVFGSSSYAWNNAVVFSNGTCNSQFNMDLHMLFPYATLWSNINLGKGQ